MASRFSERSKRLLPGIVLVVAALAGVSTALAQDTVEREGYFEVRSASTRVVEGVHTLDARLQLVLSSEALKALNSGVPLTIELQMQVIRSRRFYLDALDAELPADAFDVRHQVPGRVVLQLRVGRGATGSRGPCRAALNGVRNLKG